MQRCVGLRWGVTLRIYSASSTHILMSGKWWACATGKKSKTPLVCGVWSTNALSLSLSECVAGVRELGKVEHKNSWVVGNSD